MDSGTMINTRLWGTFSKDELKKFIMLGSIFGFTIGIYWMMRSIKDSVFSKVVGADYIPYAKGVSLAVIFFLVIAYGICVDRFERHRLFYALCSLYALIAFVFSMVMFNPTIGLTNTVASPYRLLGWAWYVFVESFASIMVAMFWSFASDTTTPESAKKGYSIIAMGAQTGGVLGPLFVVENIGTIGTSLLPAVAGLCMFMIIALIWYFMRTIPSHELVGYHGRNETQLQQQEKKSEFLEGLNLVFSQPYLLSMFGMLAFYEIVVTIFDFQFKILADKAYGNVDELSHYFGEYALTINLMALASLILGIGSIGRRIGLMVSLALFPLLLIIPIMALKVSPTLTVAFWIMVCTKALNYAFHQPNKEQLYIPTTRETRYKAKAWIDMFGARGSKFAGAAVNLLKRFLGADIFLTVSTLFSLILVGAWFLVALSLGRTHRKAITENKSIC